MNKIIALLLLVVAAAGCKDSNINANHPVPLVTVQRQINIDNPQYSRLYTQGGAVYLDDEGYRGIIVVRDYADQFYAFDRACPFHPNADCAKVIIDRAGLNIVCGSYDSNNKFTACCDSRYSLDGNIMNGPTTFPLRRYLVQSSGSILSITN